jgi:hypothetical protein
MYIKERQEEYEFGGEGNPMMRINIGTKLLLNHNYV